VLKLSLEKKESEDFIKVKREFEIFFIGTVPRLGRVVLDVAITFSVYDYILRGLDYAWPPKGNH
jgi:hypothetical protein